MTDTRTANPTPQADTRTAGSVNADRASAKVATREPEAATEAREPKAATDGGSTEPLSAAAIAQRGPIHREATARDHRSNMPEPKVAPLFSDDAAGDLRERWTDVQAGFVDEPKSAVEQADTLVAEVMKRLADSFATERRALEQQWSRGDDASTEDLRVALRRYRSFFDRLLSI